MAWENLSQSVKELRSAVDSFERERAAEICEGLIASVHAVAEPFPADHAKRILNLLRRKRWFGLMQKTANAFIQDGVDDPAVRRLYAQALIDTHQLVAAEAVLKVLAADIEGDPKEHAEAIGLLGRTYKQMYIDAANPSVPRNQDLLRKSIEHYASIFEPATPAENAWHGINVVAMLFRARRDGVQVAGYPDPADLAAAILGPIEDKHDNGQATPWDAATAVEASAALGRYEDALEWLGRYVAGGGDSFELNSTLRQLDEVWQLKPEGDTGAMMETLRLKILERGDGGRIEFKPEMVAAATVSTEGMGEPKLERILGSTGVQSFKWYQTGLDRARAVTLISDENGRGTGTGFLLKGAAISDALPPDETFVLTNAHVIAPYDQQTIDGTLDPSEAVLTFEALGIDGEWTVAELLFTSPPKELDASLLRLDREPPEVTEVPIAPRLPVADGKQRLYVIGHPLGGGLSFSLQDNLLLAHQAPDGSKVHYRTPTEPGSSGSPVFNSQWKLVALHHAGSSEMRRLDGEGFYEANEGLWIQKIREAVTEHLAQQA